MGIEKILVANRGEIAQRAIRTIKELGKKAVAIYSSADKNASYLQQADEAICIGPEKSKDSYLNIPAIISACEISEADAVFPGYGFLSENQAFVEICKLHEINFIGPSAELMAMMSDKSKAKDVMAKSGVPVIPGGSESIVKDVSHAKAVAKEIGYPVILKASAGGGGRGMRMVEEESQIKNSFLAAEAEAVTGFGDGTIYIEKFIRDPRHIEVQVMGDKHGHAIHFGERDCSLQRRHQKVVEEAPALFLSEETRANLLATAVKATKAIKYYGAGTFEFLVDDDQNFYFLELNTRLQVEHTVSEMIADVDMVELMIKVAEGGHLPAQEEIEIRGHSIECRIAAEDPNRFIPCPGVVKTWNIPGGKDVRLDSHVYAGYEVPQFYDSMIGKLIVKADTRKKAIAKMKRALGEFEVEGINTTIDFHKKIMDNKDFKDNNFNTGYLEKFLSL